MVLLQELAKGRLTWQIIFWDSGWQSETSKWFNWAPVWWDQIILQHPHKQHYSVKQGWSESGGYKTKHSGTNPRNYIQTSYIYKQGNLYNWDKVFKHQICINVALKWYHHFFPSKNTGNDVSCIHLHQSPSGFHLVGYSIIHHAKWWDSIPIPLHQ